MCPFLSLLDGVICSAHCSERIYPLVLWGPLRCCVSSVSDSHNQFIVTMNLSFHSPADCWLLPSPILPQVSSQPLWNPNRHAVNDQCCFCLAPAATIYTDGGTPQWRSLLGRKNTHTQTQMKEYVKHLTGFLTGWSHALTCLSVQINLSLLVFSLAGFLLPGYLLYHRRNLMSAKVAHDGLAATQSDKEHAPLTQSAGGAPKNQANGIAANEYTPSGYTA